MNAVDDALSFMDTTTTSTSAYGAVAVANDAAGPADSIDDSAKLLLTTLTAAAANPRSMAQAEVPPMVDECRYKFPLDNGRYAKGSGDGISSRQTVERKEQQAVVHQCFRHCARAEETASAPLRFPLHVGWVPQQSWFRETVAPLASITGMATLDVSGMQQPRQAHFPLARRQTGCFPIAASAEPFNKATLSSGSVQCVDNFKQPNFVAQRTIAKSIAQCNDSSQRQRKFPISRRTFSRGWPPSLMATATATATVTANRNEKFPSTTQINDHNQINNEFNKENNIRANVMERMVQPKEPRNDNNNINEMTHPKVTANDRAITMTTAAKKSDQVLSVRGAAVVGGASQGIQVQYAPSSTNNNAEQNEETAAQQQYKLYAPLAENLVASVFLAINNEWAALALRSTGESHHFAHKQKSTASPPSPPVDGRPQTVAADAALARQNMKSVQRQPAEQQNGEEKQKQPPALGTDGNAEEEHEFSNAARMLLEPTMVAAWREATIAASDVGKAAAVDASSRHTQTEQSDVRDTSSQEVAIAGVVIASSRRRASHCSPGALVEQQQQQQQQQQSTASDSETREREKRNVALTSSTAAAAPVPVGSHARQPNLALLGDDLNAPASDDATASAEHTTSPAAGAVSRVCQAKSMTIKRIHDNCAASEVQQTDASARECAIDNVKQLDAMKFEMQRNNMRSANSAPSSAVAKASVTAAAVARGDAAAKGAVGKGRVTDTGVTLRGSYARASLRERPLSVAAGSVSGGAPGATRDAYRATNRHSLDVLARYGSGKLDYAASSQPTNPIAQQPASSRSTSLDTAVLSSVLPERTMLRRQRRMLSQDGGGGVGEERTESTVEKLNRLRERIANTLTEVKGVIKQYKPEVEDDTAGSRLPNTTMPPCKEDDKAALLLPSRRAEEPVQLRFVRKLRKHVTLDEADDECAPEMATGAAGTIAGDESPPIVSRLLEKLKEQSFDLSRDNVAPRHNRLQEGATKTQPEVPIMEVKEATHIDEKPLECQQVDVAERQELKAPMAVSCTAAETSQNAINDSQTATSIDVSKATEATNTAPIAAQLPEQAANATENVILAKEAAQVEGQTDTGRQPPKDQTDCAALNLEHSVELVAAVQALPGKRRTSTILSEEGAVLQCESLASAESTEARSGDQLSALDAVASTASHGKSRKPDDAAQPQRDGKTPLETKARRRLSAAKVTDPTRRASIAAVEGSKIEPPVQTAAAPLLQSIKAQRRPSDSEAVIKKRKPSVLAQKAPGNAAGSSSLLGVDEAAAATAAAPKTKKSATGGRRSTLKHGCPGERPTAAAIAPATTTVTTSTTTTAPTKENVSKSIEQQAGGSVALQRGMAPSVLVAATVAKNSNKDVAPIASSVNATTTTTTATATTAEAVAKNETPASTPPKQLALANNQSTAANAIINKTAIATTTAATTTTTTVNHIAAINSKNSGDSNSTETIEATAKATSAPQRLMENAVTLLSATSNGAVNSQANVLSNSIERSICTQSVSIPLAAEQQHKDQTALTTPEAAAVANKSTDKLLDPETLKVATEQQQSNVIKPQTNTTAVGKVEGNDDDDGKELIHQATTIAPASEEAIPVAVNKRTAEAVAQAGGQQEQQEQQQQQEQQVCVEAAATAVVVVASTSITVAPISIDASSLLPVLLGDLSATTATTSTATTSTIPITTANKAERAEASAVNAISGNVTATTTTTTIKSDDDDNGEATKATGSTNIDSSAQSTSVSGVTDPGTSVAAAEDSKRMPELQVMPAPVQTVLVEHIEPLQADKAEDAKSAIQKKKVFIKKLLRQKSSDKVNKKLATPTESEGATTVTTTEETPTEKTQAALQTSEIDGLPEEAPIEDSAVEEAAAPPPAPPKKPRKIKKKVIIKRQQRRLSTGDPFFRIVDNDTPVTGAESVIETVERAIAYVTDSSDDDDGTAEYDDEEDTSTESAPLKTCMRPREYKVGDYVMYAERFKKTQVRWKKAQVLDRITSISYKLEVEGKEVPAHIMYIKRFTDHKVNFGSKEYLEIDYEQIADEEPKRNARSYSIWNMV